MRAPAAALLALAVSAPQIAAPQSALPQSATRNPQFVVDLKAVDARGRLVADLTKADFEIREGDQLRAIHGARLVRAEPRRVAVFLDEYHVSAESTATVRAALTQFVDQDLQPADELVVMRPLD